MSPKPWLCDVINAESHIGPWGGGGHPDMVAVQHTKVKYCFEIRNLCVSPES